jgi:hypothetical protein
VVLHGAGPPLNLANGADNHGRRTPGVPGSAGLPGRGPDGSSYSSHFNTSRYQLLHLREMSQTRCSLSLLPDSTQYEILSYPEAVALPDLAGSGISTWLPLGRPLTAT